MDTSDPRHAWRQDRINTNTLNHARLGLEYRHAGECTLDVPAELARERAEREREKAAPARATQRPAQRWRAE
jgi:hypothetical protein